jgi:type II secretory pathway predicted ATPase ExeA/phage tail protein X
MSCEAKWGRKTMRGTVMYIAHFGFRERPFDITVDPHFFFAHPTHKEAYAALLYGIQQKRGCIVLIGEAGTGKTTLLQRVIDELGDTIPIAFFDKTTLSFDEVLDAICRSFALQKADRRLEKIQALHEFLLARQRKGSTTALIIDEAQNLGDEVLENLRLLSNFESFNEKLVQIVLVGQPELEKKLDQPELRQLKQRIVVRYRLEHLKPQDVGPFIYHRIAVAGSERRDIFTPDAVQRIAAYSNGIPRLINTICDNALLTAYGEGKFTISKEMIEEVAHDLRLTSTTPTSAAAVLNQNSPSNTTTTHGQDEEEVAQYVRIPSASSPTTSAYQEQFLTDPYALSWSRLFRWVALILVVIVGGGLLWRFTNIPSVLRSTLSRMAEQYPILSRATGDQAVRAQFQEKATTHPVGLPKEAAPVPQDAPQSSLAPQTQKTQDLQEADSVPQEVPQPSLAPQAQKTQDSLSPVANTPSPSSLPSQEAVTSEWKGQVVTIARGDTISHLAAKMYGNNNVLAFDMIKELNPHIANLDWLSVGTQVWLPALTRETLLRQQADGSYLLILGSFPNRAAAEKAAATARRRGYTVTITPQRISGSRLLHRVVLEGLNDLTAVDRAWRLVEQSQG